MLSLKNHKLKNIKTNSSTNQKFKNFSMGQGCIGRQGSPRVAKACKGARSVAKGLKGLPRITKDFQGWLRVAKSQQVSPRLANVQGSLNGAKSHQIPPRDAKGRQGLLRGAHGGQGPQNH